MRIDHDAHRIWHESHDQAPSATSGRSERLRCTDKPIPGLKVDHDYTCPSCGEVRGVTAWPAVEFICGQYGFRCGCGEPICLGEFVQCRSRFRQDFHFIFFCSKETEHEGKHLSSGSFFETDWTDEEAEEE